MSDLRRRHSGTAAVVTGDARGVGLAIARQLVAEGAQGILLVGQDGAKGERAVVDHRGLVAGDVAFAAVEVQDPVSCLRLVDGAATRFGSVTALVNAAAGVMTGALIDDDQNVS